MSDEPSSDERRQAGSDPQLATVLDERVPCDVLGCRRSAVEVLKYRGQLGHVHVCGPCGAMDREYCDVVWSGPMPCPWPELDAVSWVDQPRAL